MPLLLKEEQRQLEGIEYWEESGVAVRCCARGLGKHLERAFAPLVSAKI